MQALSVSINTGEGRVSSKPMGFDPRPSAPLGGHERAVRRTV